MNVDTKDRHDHGFLIGLLTGTFVGTGLALWFVPRAAAELRHRVSGAAKELGTRATERYQQVSTRVAETVDDLTSKGQGVRNDVADAVARGAQEVERIATAARSDRLTEPRKHSAADRPASTARSL